MRSWMLSSIQPLVRTPPPVLAVNALRAIDRGNTLALSAVVERARAWNCVVSRGIETPVRSADLERSRLQRFLTRLGVDSSGPLQVLGLKLQLVDRDDGFLAVTVPSILEGFPLASAAPVFEAAGRSLAQSIYSTRVGMA